MNFLASLIVPGCLAGMIGCAAALAAPGAPSSRPAATPSPSATQPAEALSDVRVNQAEVDKLQKYWDDRVSPHRKALQEAAEAHYKVLTDLRREQQRLIDEADRIQRTIDKLEKEYQDMTTPRPEAGQ